tara:strand:+ start:1269 stop:1493 length:225 start_codon:yes stop_codon:yes gene_type:complete
MTEHSKAQLRQLHTEALDMCERYIARLHQAHKKAKWLDDKLRQYGRHAGWCIEQTKVSCSCQFTDVLNESEKYN